MTYPLVTELAAAGIPVTVSCRVLKLARQLYYRWRNDPIRDADVLRAHRINALHDALGGLTPIEFEAKLTEQPLFLAA